MRRLAALSAVCAALWAAPALAEEMALAPASYPDLPAHAAAPEGFAPGGWSVESRAAGDLDGDRLPDLALVLRGQNPALVAPNPGGLGSDVVDTNPRVIVIAFAEASGGYRLAAQNHMLIPRMNDPNLADYLENGGLSIVNGTLHVQLGLWYSSGSWESSTYTFTLRWQRGRFELIGYDSERTWRNTGEVTEVSINYSNRRVVVSRGNMQTEVNPTGRPFYIPRRDPITLDAIGDGIQFDPGVNVG